MSENVFGNSDFTVIAEKMKLKWGVKESKVENKGKQIQVVKGYIRESKVEIKVKQILKGDVKKRWVEIK